MFKRGRVGVLLALVVGVLGTVDVGAAAGGGSLPARSAPPAVSGFPGSSGPPEGAIEASRAKEARLRESWQSKASRDERKASRRRFKDLSRGGARALGEREHPSVFSPEVWAPLAGVKRRGGFLDAYSARVTLPNGTNAVAVSYLPLVARDEAGEQRAVDLDLVERSGALVPENPLVETVIPARSSDPVRVGDVGFDLGGDVPVQLDNNRAFYADAGGQDIDLVVMPTPSGVETFAQIRSVDAPEEVRMAFDLPAGTELRGAAGAVDGALEVVRGGEVIATVTRPLAVDAQQRPVPVEYRVEGDDLVMEVAHRSGDFAMPIMLDPTVVYGWNNNPRRYDSTGWGVYQSNPGSRWCSYFGDGYAGYGQYTFGRPESYQPCSSTWYSANEVYEFNYYGEYWRGSTAFVEGWDEGTNFDAGWGGACRYSGIYSVGLGRWETFSGNECQTAWNRVRYHRAPGTPPNYAVFGTVINGSGLRQNFTNQLWGATVFVSDRDNPTVEQGPRRIPAGWTKDTVIDVTARDTGIGVDWTRIRLSTPGQPDHLESRLHPCSADPANHCPSQDDFAYATNDMPEGVRTVSAQAGDLIRQAPFAELGTIKIDRTAPVIVDFPGAVRPGGALPAGVHQFSVRADDTGAGNTTNSGVKKFEFSIDGGGWSDASATCASGPCSHSFSVDARAGTGLSEGEHTVRVRVTDEVGLISRERAFTIVVDRTAPTLRLQGALKDKAGSQLVDGVWTMDAVAEDDSLSRTTAGVRDIEVFVDGQPLRFEGQASGRIEEPCTEGNCPLDWEVVFDTQEYQEGPREMQVKASDHAGNPAPTQTIQFSSSKQDAPCSSPPFTVYNVGSILEGLSMTEGTRVCSPADPRFPGLGRQDDVTYLYGNCPEVEGEGSDVEGGCLPPIEVQSTPVCQKHASLYRDQMLTIPYEPLTIRGVPAASFDDGRLIEVYTTDTTITIYGLDPAQTRRFAEALKLALPQDIPVGTQQLLSLSDASLTAPILPVLPPPIPAILEQQEPC